MREILTDEQYRLLPTLKKAEPLDLAAAIHDVLYDKRGRKIKVLHVEEKTTLAHYFVLCTGTSSTHVKSLADEVEYKMRLRGLHPANVEGRGNGAWVLLDFGTVIVHVFSREARDFYNLDKLYSDTKEVDMSASEDKEENEAEAETETGTDAEAETGSGDDALAEKDNLPGN
jgi:ribosome-associated protein